jgi:hypothetical protein
MGCYGLNSSDSGQGPVEVEQGNELSSFIESWEILE